MSLKMPRTQKQGQEFILAMKTWSISDDSGWHPNWRAARTSSLIHDQDSETWCPLVDLDLDAYFFGECVAIYRFEDMRLAERNFVAQKLVAAHFNRAVLDFADFSFVIASMASFAQAHLFAARFVHAQLIFANFSEADLRSSSFIGADLCRANFQAANLEDAQLKDACLEKSNFGEADLRGADLRGIETQGASWKKCVFSDRTRLPFDFEKAIAEGMIYQPDTERPHGTV